MSSIKIETITVYCPEVVRYYNDQKDPQRQQLWIQTYLGSLSLDGVVCVWRHLVRRHTSLVVWEEFIHTDWFYFGDSFYRTMIWRDLVHPHKRQEDTINIIGVVLKRLLCRNFNKHKNEQRLTWHSRDS